MTTTQTQSSQLSSITDTPIRCPFCQSHQIRTGEAQPEDHQIVAIAECESCAETWKEIYDFDHAVAGEKTLSQEPMACPYCHSSDIYSGRETPDANMMTRDGNCNACHGDWEEFFSFEGCEATS